MFTRYLVAFLLSINGLFIIYYFFAPITYYLSLVGLSIAGNAQGFFLERIIIFNGLSIELVDACIAASAYYLLIVLILATPMGVRVRFKALVISIFLLLIINILRIIIFSVIAVNGWNYFDSLHLLTWYFLSIIIVIGLWFGITKLYSINGVPVYTDVKRVMSLIK